MNLGTRRALNYRTISAFLSIAVINLHLGKYNESKIHAELALAKSRKTGCKKTEESCKQMLCVFLAFGLNQHDQNTECLNEMLQVTRKSGDTETEATAYYLLAMRHIEVGQMDEAAECLEKSIQTSRKGRSVFMRLGTVLIELQQFDEALKCLHKGLDICGEDKSGYHTLHCKDQIYIQLCRLHLLCGELEKAKEYLTKILTGSWHEKKHTSLRNLGAYISGCGYFEQACDILAESIEGYENSLEPLSNESKLSVGELEANILMYNSRFFLLFALGKFAEALCTAERGRAHVLTKLLAKKYGIQEKVKFSETDLHSLMSSLAKRQILLFFGSGSYKKILWIMTNEQGPNLEAMSQEKAEVDCLLKAFSRSLSCGRSINCEDRSLSALYENQSAANGTQHIKVREKRLFDDSDDEELEAQNLPNQLYNTLIAPFANRIQGRELVLAPEGSMVMVPFAALRDNSGKYLSDSCSIRMSPSLSTLKLILDSPKNYHCQTGALIVGDPQVSHATPLWQLKAARQEAKEIADLLEVEPLLGEQATKEEVLRRITDVCLIHIAAHGDAERGEIACAPNRSSSQEPSKEDYMLTMKDIANVRIRAKLVVLSCCHSAKGKILQAEGVVGIARAFIASGARSVLVSLWAVDDKATKDFMVRFYGHLKCDKMSASEALHQTVKWMRESKTARYTVREWAPFVLIGDDVNLNL
ncbi:Tetratricopeptide repeat protein 28 [Stylophora pistillata]|uniref:Tetratricopeptide repeat protein 28 n=1 Tax=Stylophora pistillata TaxID=50429 RepID=A0A2B4SIQ1_STYPI|nr:Tetratricopeptide repeat protein 28 [Stylophora pistillata]